tara:strand:+ start:7444 stop:8637 length:1194 start_codon:yes stop_codon:yes gene_type:complete
MSYITDTSTPASKVIHLDSTHANLIYSQDEDGNDITTNFTYDMKEAIVCPDHLSMICSLHTATIPYSFYNVRNNINNHVILQYTSNFGTNIFAGRYKIVMPSGSYNALNLINTFRDIMNGSVNYLEKPWATEGGIAYYRIYFDSFGTWSPLTAGFNPFTNTGGGKVANIVNVSLDRTRLRYHIWDNNDSTGENTISMEWDDAETTMADFFGFRTQNLIQSDKDIPYSTDGTTFLGSDKIIDINDEIHGLYLRTSLTTDGTLNSETGTFSNILARISINTNFGGVIFHTPNNSSHKLQISLPVIKFIGIKLTDDKNRPIDLNGLNFQISIQIDFVKRLSSLRGLTREQRRAGLEKYEKATNQIEVGAEGIKMQEEVGNDPNNIDMKVKIRKKKKDKIK